MNVACPSCQTKYSVDDGRIPPSGVTIKCPKCQHVFVAKKDAQGQASIKSAASSGPVALPGGASAVPLPGKQGAVPLPGGKGAVPLPGAQAQGRTPPLPAARPPSKPHGGNDEDGELDLGLDDAPLPVPKGPSPKAPPKSLAPPSKAAPQAPPPKAAPPPAAKSKAQPAGEALDFIDETAGKAGLSDGNREASAEFRVRRRNGRSEGPFGAGRIVAMLRNKEFTGGEDISEDGVQWRSMTSNAQFNAVINEIASQEDALSFGNVDLPAPQDLPTPRGPDNLPKSKGKPSGPPAKAQIQPSSSPPAYSQPPAASGEFNLGFEEEVEARGPSRSQTYSQTKQSGGVQPPPGMAEVDDLELDRPQDQAPKPKKRPSPEMSEDLEAPPPAASSSAGALAGADGLEVGEIPQLPPIWQTYRKPIIAFGGVIVVFMIGFFTHLWLPCGAFGLKCVASLLQPPPPPPPEAPPPPPPKLADAKEIASLIDEGSYEAIRSVLATIDQLGPTLPDNMLAAAKARGFGTLAYGPPEYTLEALTKAVDALNTMDLSKALGGKAGSASNEILKARAMVAILNSAAQSVEKDLTGALEQKQDDKELALLLGLARHKMGDDKGALEALDKAIVADAKYAPALHAIGEVTLALGNAEDAATWFVKALTAQPAHSRSGVAAAKIYEDLHHYGQRRRVLALAAEKSSRGLPADKRAQFQYETAKAHFDADLADKARPFAQEAARLDPANTVYVAAAAIALAAADQPKEGQKLIDAVIKRAPNDIDALLARAHVFLKMDDVAKAFIDLEAAKKLAPKDLRVPMTEARFNIDLAKLNDAREALKRALKMDTASPLPNILSGRVDLSVGDVDSAFKNATDAVKKDPNNASGHALLGDCLLLRDEIEKALESYSTALKLDDENVPARIGYADALRDMGAKNSKMRSKIAEAVPMYLNILADNPKNPTAMFEYGRALELQGDLPGALALYGEAAGLDVKDVRPHLKMAAANIEKDPPDLQAANKSISAARRIEAGSARPNGHVRFWEARLALLEGRVHDAEAAMRSAVELEPRNALFLYWLGRMLEANNSLYEAVGYYEKAVSMNSRLAVAWRALGKTAVERNQYDKAREMFDRYRESAPDDHSIWVDIGESYTKQNREEEALKAFETALKFDSKNARALTEIGLGMERRGQSAEAKKYFERATKADPSNTDATCYYGLALNTKEKLTKEARKALEKCVNSKSTSEDLRALASDALAGTARAR